MMARAGGTYYKLPDGSIVPAAEYEKEQAPEAVSETVDKEDFSDVSTQENITSED